MMSVVTETHAEAGQGRALLLVVTVAYKPIGECENFLLERDGAHIQKPHNWLQYFYTVHQCPRTAVLSLFCNLQRPVYMEDNFFQGPGLGDGFR